MTASRGAGGALLDAGIVRNRAKIEGTINNARRCLDVIEEFGSLAAYVWSFEPKDASRRASLDWNILVGMDPSEEAKALACFRRPALRSQVGRKAARDPTP